VLLKYHQLSIKKRYYQYNIPNFLCKVKQNSRKSLASGLFLKFIPLFEENVFFSKFFKRDIDFLGKDAKILFVVL